MKKLRSDVIRKYLQTPLPQTDDLLFWDELLEAFSFSVLIFLLSNEGRRRFPYKQLGYRKVKLDSITPAQNEVWILFSFQGSFRPDSPLCGDGFLLPCEWRKTDKDCKLLPTSLCNLALAVSSQQNAAGWKLYPSFSRFGDRIDFSDETLFASLENESLIASAWSALSIGLYYALHEIIPSQWPFSSIQYNFASKRLESVSGLEKKVRIAQFYHAPNFMVAKSQLAETKTLSVKTIRFIAAPNSGNLNAVVADLALGVLRQRKKNLCIFSCIFIAFVLLILGGIGADYAWRRPYYKYYTVFFNNKQQLFRGAAQLSIKEAEKRNGNFRFTYKGAWGDLKEISLVDGLERFSAFGTLDPLVSDRLELSPRNDLQRTVRLEISGHEASGFDSFGNKTWTFVCTDVGEEREYRFQRGGGGNIVSGNVCYVKMAFDEKTGDMRSLRFFDQRNCPTADVHNVYGFKVDSKIVDDFLLITYTLQNQDMKPIRGIDGYCQAKQKFSLSPFRLHEQTYCDEDGNPIITTTGLAGTTYQYDEFNNVNLIRNLDTNGNLVGTQLLPMRIDCSFNVADGTYTFNEKWPMGITQTRIVKVNSIGIKRREERICEWPNGSQNITLFRYRFENSGHSVFQILESGDGKKRDEYQTEFDTMGRIVKSAQLVSSDPEANQLPAFTTYDYQEAPGKNGWCIITAHHWKKNGDKFDVPRLRHISRALHMPNKLLKEITFFDANGDKVEQDENGLKYHKRVFEYHYGFLTKVANYNLNGDLCFGLWPAELTREYNAQNFLTREYFHRGKKLLNHPQTGIAETRYEYDSLTGILQEKYFYDSNGKIIEKRNNRL